MTKSLFSKLAVIAFFVTAFMVQELDVSLDNSKSLESLKHPYNFNFLITQKGVQEDLELAGSQVKQIETATIKMGKLHDEYKDAVRDLGDMKQINELRDGLWERWAVEVEEIKSELLPHQLKRLEQIQFQFDLMIQNPELITTVLLSPSVVDGLEITERQRKLIENTYQERNARIRRLYQQYEEEFREINKQSQRQALGHLNDEQKAEVESKIGSPSWVFISPVKVGDILNNDHGEHNRGDEPTSR